MEATDYERIAFTRLTQIPPAEIIDLMNDPAEGRSVAVAGFPRRWRDRNPRAAFYSLPTQSKLEDMKKTIIELEERLKLAMLNSDVAELDALISPDLLFTNHLGLLMSKADDLDAHKSKAFVLKSLDLSESQIRIYRDSAVVSVKAEIQGEYHGQPASGNFRFTRAWLKIAGKWQVVAGHSSVIA